ncbi:PAS domain-containing protein [bacterium]|nr:PAS domain-containing protein [bacterium]
MQEFLQSFPRPVLVIDGGLEIRNFSRKAFSVFGLRYRDYADEPQDRLAQVLVDERDLGDELALATARLMRPGDEERFDWEHRKRSYEVGVYAQEDDAFLVLFEDTTDYAISEEILMNARGYLEHILSNIPLGVVVLNSELRITSMNRQEQRFLKEMGVEFTLIDAIGASLEELLPEDLGTGWQALCQKVLDTGERAEEAKKTFVSSGGELVLDTLATPLPDASGRAAGVILIADDVTEEARLESELVKAEKLATVGQMVITINHEINNPLTIISSSAQTLRILNKDLDEKAVAKLLRIEDQVKRISAVTDRLRKLDEIATNEYIRDGEQMIDVWNADCEEDQE